MIEPSLFGAPTMLAATLVWGAWQWLAGAVALGVVLLAILIWSYALRGPSTGVRMLGATLKTIAIVLLALCLLDPMIGGNRVKPGANQFVILVDNSGSMTLRDRDTKESRGEKIKTLTATPSPWISRIAADFDVRQYAFDSQFRALPDSDTLSLDGDASNLGSALEKLARRYQSRPLAGILLLTDGNATDPDTLERFVQQTSAARAAGSAAPAPIYPVILSKDHPSADISVQKVAVTQTNFEDAPVTMNAQISAADFKGRTLFAELRDESGKTVERQTISVTDDSQPQLVRFRVKPEQPGVSFYQVHVGDTDAPAVVITPATRPASQTESPTTSPQSDAAVAPSMNDATAGGEATLANNVRTIAVDRGQGPYRILYVTGRPNWEYKFLQRALQSDDQVQLVGLIRVAKREPKFNFIGHRGEESNPLFRGFDNKSPDDAEQYDQPVLVRLNTEDDLELAGGFPKTAKDLYRYSAVIIDDVESEFFTTDQMVLLKDFVRNRGGGVLMLGGEESFRNGKYDRTPIGDLLPVYLDEATTPPVDMQWRMDLSKEGWLEPSMRLRAEEDAERQRIEAMPPFAALNTVRAIKPGATILARAIGTDNSNVPAMVQQRFGRGRSAALLIGDLWRWDLHRPANSPSDLERAWRQTIRWMVAEVPRRVELTLATPTSADEAPGLIQLSVRVRDDEFAAMDNASVNLNIIGPDGKNVELRAEASTAEPGLYQASYMPRQSGAYRLEAKATSADGAALPPARTGWATDPAADEFQRLAVNIELLERLAKASGGEAVPFDKLDEFVSSLTTRNAPITEQYVRPLWHQIWVFAVAIACLAGEWGLRRWKGLA
jgi:uncharacterized membrane protein